MILTASEKSQQVRDLRRARGQCLDCPKPPKPAVAGRVRCEDCLRRHAIYGWKNRTRWAREKRCIGCSLPRGRHKHCDACIKRIAEAQKRLKQERRAAGLCTLCGEPAGTRFARCFRCRQKQSLRLQRLYVKQRNDQVAEGPQLIENTAGYGSQNA